MIELKSLLESTAKDPKQLMLMSFEIADVGISEFDPGSFKHQYYVQWI